MNIFVIGVGLIGGSFAIDAKATLQQVQLFGIDQNQNHLDQAIRLGYIDSKATMEDIDKADVVILSIPVHAALALLPKILDGISDSCIVFDVGSTKKKICDRVADHPKRRNFLATHPIAGTEFSGPKAAMANLYRNQTNIVCEIEKTAFTLQEKAIAIFAKLGMRIRYMHPEAHDKHIAYMSHLSHISSFMLGQTVMQKEKNERDIFDMAGSGFASTVRLAKSSPEMWTPIFKHNRENVIGALDEYIQNLNTFKQFLEEKDYESIHEVMKATNRIQYILNLL